MRELVLDAGRCYIPFLLLFHGALYLVSLFRPFSICLYG
jgi:hypothetical protein